MRDPRFPDTIGGNILVGDDGVLSTNGQDVFPWYTKEGFLGGTVRYRLLAEDIDAMNDLFCSSTQQQERFGVK